MIWLVFACLSLACALYVCAPLYAAFVQGDQPEAAELETYLAEVSALEAGEMTSEQTQRKTELERRVLTLSSKEISQSPRPARGWLAGVAILVIAGSAGLYNVIGRPDLIRIQTAPTAQSAQDFAALTDELGRRLAADPSPAEGWQLYARSLMRLGRYDEAMAAYEQAYNRSDDKTLIEQEREQAQAFITLQNAPRGNIPIPDGGNVEAVMSLDEESQTLMIAAMVDGLAARLEDNPDDVQGWIRLLTARQVLGDEEKLAADIAAMRLHYKTAPDTVSTILDAAGLPRK